MNKNKKIKLNQKDLIMEEFLQNNYENKSKTKDTVEHNFEFEPLVLDTPTGKEKLDLSKTLMLKEKEQRQIKKHIQTYNKNKQTNNQKVKSKTSKKIQNQEQTKLKVKKQRKNNFNFITYFT